MNDFPWTPQHDEPTKPKPEALTEEVVPDSGDQTAPQEAVVDKPTPKKPAAKKAAPKKNVTTTTRKTR